MSTYNSAKNRQSETRSSAWAFLLVGCIGFVIILLGMLMDALLNSEAAPAKGEEIAMKN